MKCPKCGEELPLLSKVCPVCKTVVDKEDGAPDAMALARAMDGEILNIKRLVPESGQIKLEGYIWLYLIIAGLFVALLATKSGAGLLWILSLAAFIAAIPAYRKTRKITVASKLAESKISYEYGITLIKRYFKGNSEMSRFLEENASVVNQAEAGIRSGRKRNMLIGLGVAIAEAVILGAILIAIPSKGENKSDGIPADYDGRVAWFIKAGDPQQAIDAYASSEYNNDAAGGLKRVELTEALCQAGYTAEAESFVLKYCVGKMQDFDCAKAVVQSYVADGNSDAAISFVGKCTLMRYKSDVNKLKALI